MEAAELKRRVDMVELCRRLGLDPKGKVARCPAHNDQGRPNLAIYDDHVFCFACEWTGDAFDLVAKVNRTDFQGAKAFVADFVGLPLIGDYRQSKPSTRSSAPPTKPLPSKPAPQPVEPVVIYCDTFEEATETHRAHWVPDGEIPLLQRCEDGRWRVTAWPMSRDIGATPAPFDPGQSLRAKVFADLLTFAKPVADGDKVTRAGAWLEAEKGITIETQLRFGLCILDWEAANAGLRQMHDEATLRRYGLLTDKGDLVFRRWDNDAHCWHYFRLLFPFYWKGAVVDVQGRNIAATDKRLRFENTRGKNPIPYNADDLVEARRTGKPVFVCEGATDTLTLAQSGRLVVGIVGASGFKADWLPSFEGLTVYLAFDADEAGRKAATDVTRLFVDAGLSKPKVIKLPEGAKDINQYLRKEVTE